VSSQFHLSKDPTSRSTSTSVRMSVGTLVLWKLEGGQNTLEKEVFLGFCLSTHVGNCLIKTQNILQKASAVSSQLVSRNGS
jgi:hypothetical protein